MRCADSLYAIKRLSGCAGGAWLVGLLLLTISFSFPTHLYGAQSDQAKRVLFVSTGSRFSVGFPILEQSIIDRLWQLYPGALEFYGEYLDLVRFPRENYQRLFQNILRDKYTDDPPDLIMLTYVGNLGVAEKLLEELFPKTPVVAAGLTEEEIPTTRAGSRLSGLAQRSDPRGTIQLLRRLQPDIQRVVLVGGTAEVDHQVMSRTRQALRSLGEPLEVEVWDTRSLPEILGAVTSLSPQEAILFTRMFRDGAGRATISTNVAQSVARVSNAPVYVMSDPMIGTGAVGGSVAEIPSLGRRAGEIAHRILSGADPKSLPLEILSQGVPIFDWRALQRWGIPESRLPENSVVRFRPVSIWEQYRWYIIAVLTVVALQAVMIAGLMLQRARRRHAETELRESRELMEIATSAGEVGLWVRDLKNGNLWANERLRSMFGFGPKDPLRLEDLLARVRADDRSRIVSTVERAQDTNSPFETEFRAIWPDANERWFVAKGQAAGHPNGPAARRMGVMMDITGRKETESAERRHRDELAHATRRATLGELTSSIAHELNQPLGAILSNAEAAEMLLKSEPPALDEVREILADIRADDRRASDVILGMRRLLRKQDIERAPLQINEAIREVLKLLNTDAAHRKVTVKFEPTENLPLVDGDRVQLQQVILNLVLNAMEATT
ncbi:MAG TPA: ABC transporter substrate binding protein, partial [Candidatus Limnocylindrales bacterium]|nr:ABC transporter substrate binding protein [Candidatus Limnocylindrales bacterium]